MHLTRFAPHPRIEYRVASAEESGLAAESVDLVVAAAAIHWFDLDRFCKEVHRVIRRGGVLAVWTYHVADLYPPLNEILWPFYRDAVGKYFAAGARMVDARYEGLTLPGKELAAPAFTVSVRWSAEDVLSFVKWLVIAAGHTPGLASPEVVREVGVFSSAMTLRRCSIVYFHNQACKVIMSYAQESPDRGNIQEDA